MGENWPKVLKSSQNSCQAKKSKIPTTKLYLKVQNIYIKPLWNDKISKSNHVLKIAYLDENVKIWLIAKMLEFLWATYLSKNPNEHPNVAQLAKNAQSGHPCRALD